MLNLFLINKKLKCRDERSEPRQQFLKISVIFCISTSYFNFRLVLYSTTQKSEISNFSDWIYQICSNKLQKVLRVCIQWRNQRGGLVVETPPQIGKNSQTKGKIRGKTRGKGKNSGENKRKGEKFGEKTEKSEEN